MLSGVDSKLGAYLAATVFYVGVCFMWPTMLGIAAERFPRGGAITIGYLGFIGQFALGLVIFQSGEIRDKLGAAKSFQAIALLPVIAFFIFAGWWIRDYKSGGYKAINLVDDVNKNGK
jgi:hypothetical protein